MNGRGGGWVVMQFALMSAMLAAAVIWREQWHSPFSLGAGGVLLSFGAWAGLCGKRDLGRVRTPFPKPKDDGELITHGIYAGIRHPLYASVMALGFAWALFWASIPALLLAAVQTVFLHLKARHEEAWLQEKYPGYADYAARTARYLPRIRRARTPPV